MIDDWFLGWLEEHLMRHARELLPSSESEDGRVLYTTWKKIFRMRGIHDPDIAAEASERLLAEPGKHPRDHFPTLLRHALELYQVRGIAAGSGVDPHSREAAERASKGCAHCDGSGLAVVWYGPARAEGSKIPDCVAAYCVCALGRWIERNHAEKSPDVRKRMPDLADVFRGQSVWRAERPEINAELVKSG